jgi:hypothetical protein
MKPKSKSFVIRFLARGSFRYAKRCVKNCAKILIGRKPYFSAQDIFFWHSLCQVLGVRPIRKITCISSTHEGGGAQALMMIRAIAFARECGLMYVHTPFNEIAHADRPMQDWVAAWERHFNIGAGEAVVDSNDGQLANFAFNFNDMSELFGVRDLARMFEATVPEFRRKYYLNKSPRKTDELTVAVHVRRGDAHPDNPHYYTGNETILRTITAVKSALDACRVRYSVRIYSQGSRNAFAELSLPGVEFFLDADPIWTMEELIEADVLVLAKGYFSHYAALISDGIKIGVPRDREWWLSPPLDNCIPCLPDGSFDSAEFERRLFPLIRSKTTAATRA